MEVASSQSDRFSEPLYEAAGRCTLAQHDVKQAARTLSVGCWPSPS